MGDERKYEIFISSTYEDLKEERTYLQQQIVRMGHVPVGMEFFNLGNVDQWAAVKKIIDKHCDYYVVILAGRYGSTDAKGVSFTQREFEYAVRRKKPTIAYVLSDEGIRKLPADKIDDDLTCLEGFRKEVSKKYVHYWDRQRDLKDKIGTTLAPWIERHPRLGWVRGFSTIERDVYKFLVNALTPIEDFNLTEDYLDDLPTNIEDVSQLISCFNTLLGSYVKPRLPAEMRAYFAYMIQQPAAAAAPGGDDETAKRRVAYRLGLSTKRQGTWSPGMGVAIDSNVHYIFETAQPSLVRDTEKPGARTNQHIRTERSVFAAPVMVGDVVIGVVGFSSPRKGVQVYDTFCQDVARMFSALAHSFSLASHDDVLSTGEGIRDALGQHLEDFFKSRRFKGAKALQHPR